MAILKTPTIPKHAMPDDITAIPVTYPGSGGVISGTPAQSRFTNNWVDPSVFNKASEPHAIQGKMLVAQQTISSHELERLSFNTAALTAQHQMKIKSDLIQLMVQEMFAADCIEFTHQKDMATDSVTFRARVFVVPNGDVQLIRKMQK